MFSFRNRIHDPPGDVKFFLNVNQVEPDNGAVG